MQEKYNNNLNLNPLFLYSFGLQYLCLLFYSLSDVVGSTYWNLRYLDNGDVWGDFTKWFTSFNTYTEYSEKISNWPILKRFDTAYFAYAKGSPYTNDPEQISNNMGNFHLPPFSGLLGKFINFLSINIGPSTVYILLLFILFGYLFKLLISKRNNLKISLKTTLILCFLIFFDYPMQFAISKGNTGALLSTISLIYSSIFLISGEKNKAIFWSIFAALNRPNLIFISLLIASSYKNLNSIKLPNIVIKYLNPILVFISFYFLNSLTQFLLWIIDNNYNFKNFKIGLDTYHRMMALGDSGLAFGSSLHGLMKIILKVLTGISFKTELNYGLSNFLIYFCILIGSLLSLVIIIKYKSKALNFESSWLALVILNLISTPVFADYHLSIFISAVIIYLGFSKLNNSRSNVNLFLLKEKIFFGFIAIIIAPWQIYIAPDQFPYGLGVIIRPLVSSIFLFLIFKNSNFIFKKPLNILS